jgi:hypothetical protein
MADLRLSEAGILRQFLDDHSGRIALKAFFANRAAYHTGRAVSYLTSYDEKNAMEHAFFANCFSQGFSDLEQFCKEQLAKAEV